MKLTVGNSIEFIPALHWYSDRGLLIWLNSLTSFIQQTLPEHLLCWTPERQVKGLLPTMRNSPSGGRIVSMPCTLLLRDMPVACWTCRVAGQTGGPGRAPGKVLPQLHPEQLRGRRQRGGRAQRGLEGLSNQGNEGHKGRATRTLGLRGAENASRDHEGDKPFATTQKLEDNVNRAISINFLFGSYFLPDWLPSLEKTALWPWEFGCKYDPILSSSCVQPTTRAAYW